MAKKKNRGGMTPGEYAGHRTQMIRKAHGEHRQRSGRLEAMDAAVGPLGNARAVGEIVGKTKCLQDTTLHMNLKGEKAGDSKLPLGPAEEKHPEKDPKPTHSEKWA